ncbi:hypothetical protein [Rothia nasisuis]|uniref:hypothetical protein n=1 Tax=Rothia nasisuis TaxID=2109647 RepID=UPI001F42A155|nr:hypothetical protein [Rothia nasisuis]
MPLYEDIGNGVKDKVADIAIYVSRKMAQHDGDVSETVSDVISDILPDPIEKLVTSSYNGMFNLMQQFMTSWMDYSPSINFQGDTMTWLTALTAPLTGFFAVLGLIVAGGRVMLFQRGEDIRTAVIGLARVVGVAAAATSIATIFIPVSDLFADWVLEMAQPNFSLDGNYPTAETVVGVLGGSTLAFSGVNVILIFIQWCLMIVRAVALPIMVGFWTVSEAINMLKGDVKMTPVARWIVAFLLFKPVVAVIYGFAFKLMQGYDNFDGVFTGMAMIAVSIFALPSLLRVLAPDAMAAGTSGGGKELMALMGALTAAAAVVASGGAGAAGAGAAGGASGGAGAAGAGAAGATGGTAGGAAGGAWQGPTLAESGWGQASRQSSAPAGNTGGPQSEAPRPEKNLGDQPKETPGVQPSGQNTQGKGSSESQPSADKNEAPSATLDQTGYTPEDVGGNDASDMGSIGASTEPITPDSSASTSQAETHDYSQDSENSMGADADSGPSELPLSNVPDSGTQVDDAPADSSPGSGPQATTEATNDVSTTGELSVGSQFEGAPSDSLPAENQSFDSSATLPHSLPNHRTAGPTSNYPRQKQPSQIGQPSPLPAGKIAELFRTAQYTIQSMPKLEDTFFDERGMR